MKPLLWKPLIHLIIVIAFLSFGLASANEFQLSMSQGYRGSDRLTDAITGDTLRLDESRSINLILSIPRDVLSDYDLFLSRQTTKLRNLTAPLDSLSLRLDHVHLGGTVDYPLNYLSFFTTGGIGFTRITPDNTDFDSETRLSFSFGGGLKIPLHKQVGLRLEARFLGIVTDNNGSILCSSDGCIAQFNASFFTQYEASAGLYILF